MSIDLDWSALDAQLTLACTRFLADAFNAAPRPDFVGPLQITAFSFGDAQPHVTLDDITDIQHEFIQPADDDDDDLARPSQEHAHPLPSPQEDPAPLLFQPKTYPGSPTASVAGSGPLPPLVASSGAALFSPGLLHHPSFQGPPGLGAGLGGVGGRHGRSGSRSRSRSPAAHLFQPHAHPLAQAHPHAHATDGHSHSHTHPHSYEPPSPTRSAASLPPLPLPSSAPSPSFQVHLRLSYAGNLALGLSTALLINYPSPAFMSLPLSLTLTGLALEATLVVAFEGGRRRVHLSLLDPGDDLLSAGPGDSPSKPSLARTPGAIKATPGARVLRAAHVESEVGQADKHVLRNVGKVEKFVLEVARKTLENELVFPNFQTIVF